MKAVLRDHLLQGPAVEPRHITDSAPTAHGLLQKTQPFDVFICIKTATGITPWGAYALVPALPDTNYVLGDAGSGGYHPDGVAWLGSGVLLRHGQ